MTTTTLERPAGTADAAAPGMRITIARADLLAALNWAAKGLPSRPVVPILAGMRLTVTGDELTAEAFDYQTAARARVAGAAGQPGTILVRGAMLVTAVKGTASGKSATVTLETTAAGVRVISAGASVTVPALPDEDYPALPAMPPAAGTVSGAAFARAAGRAVLAAGRDDTLPVLTAVSLQTGPAALTMTATDRYRLAVEDVPWTPADGAPAGQYLVPAVALATFAKACGKETTVSLYFTTGSGNASEFAGFRMGHRELITHLTGGEFPNRLAEKIPAEHTTQATADASALRAAVVRAAKLCARNEPVIVSCTDGWITVEIRGNDETPGSSESLPGTLTGPEIAAAANPGYLADGLSCVDGTVRLAFTDPGKPLLITGEDAGTFRWLQMPIRVPNLEPAHPVVESSTDRAEADPATETASPTEPSIPQDMPPEQAKRDSAGTDMGEDMDTEQAPAPTDYAARAADRQARRDAARQRASIRVDAARQRAREQHAARTQVAIPEQAAVAPAAYKLAPARVYAEPIDGAQLLNRAFRYFGHMAKWSSLAAQVTGVLYSAHCHARDDKTKLPVFLYEPHLCLHALEGGSGKSWSARMISSLAPDPKRLGEMTKASFVALVAQRHTVIITELDKLVATSGKRCAWLPGIANLMFEFDGATSVMKGGAPLEIPLFAPLIFDGNDCMFKTTGGELLTMFDRCIKLLCVKAPPLPDGTAYHPPRYDLKVRGFAKDLQADLAEWMAQEVKEDLAEHVPDMPKHLGNRPFDLWEPLFTVAERAGGDWPELCRYACEYIESPAAIAAQAEDEGEEDPGAARREKQDAQLDEWGTSGPTLPGRMVSADDGWDIRESDVNLDAGIDVEGALS